MLGCSFSPETLTGQKNARFYNRFRGFVKQIGAEHINPAAGMEAGNEPCGYHE
jgi:hypothetical protein